MGTWDVAEYGLEILLGDGKQVDVGLVHKMAIIQYHKYTSSEYTTSIQCFFLVLLLAATQIEHRFAPGEGSGLGHHILKIDFGTVMVVIMLAFPDDVHRTLTVLNLREMLLLFAELLI